MLVIHRMQVLVTGRHRQARGTHINVRKPRKVRFSCHGTFLKHMTIEGIVLAQHLKHMTKEGIAFDGHVKHMTKVGIST